jgi:hypothetical protein
MMPTIMAALGEDDRTPTAGVEGVRQPRGGRAGGGAGAGTEVRATRVGGRERGPAGRWAQLRRHPWFGEQRLWFGHRPAPQARGRGPRRRPRRRSNGRSAASP